MHTDTVSIEQFCKDNRIVMNAFRVDSNPNMGDSARMDHWKVKLVRTFEGSASYTSRETGHSSKRTYTKAFTTFFSMGYGHHGAEPGVQDVLDCLASDASGIDNVRSFEDWCSEYGYDTDSRKAEKTFKACEHSAKRLKAFLGADLFAQLLYSTERL